MKESLFPDTVVAGYWKSLNQNINSCVNANFSLNFRKAATVSIYTCQFTRVLETYLCRLFGIYIYLPEGLSIPQESYGRSIPQESYTQKCN